MSAAVSTRERADLLSASRSELRALLQAGHPLSADELAGWTYRGTSLGLPGWVDRLAWKTFAKAFLADEQGVRGWNVRVEQDRAELTPQLRRGAPITFGHFRVVPAAGPDLPRGALLLDYGQGANARLDPLSCVRHPLVALAPGDPTRLLGWSYLSLGGLRLGPPSYFLLERAEPVSYVPS